MNKIEQLKKLVFDGGYDKESKDLVLQYEQELMEIAAAEKLLLNPVIKKYIDYLDTEARRCTVLLSQDRKLTELQRGILFEKRDICEHLTSLFTGKKKEQINNELNDLLDVERN